MMEKLKNLPYWVYDTLSIVSSIITIITAIVCISNAAIDIKKINGEYIVYFDRLLFWIIVMIIFFLIVVMVKLRKYSILLKRERKILSYNYYNAAHDLRNAYFDIMKKYKKNKNTDKSNMIESLTKDTKQFLSDSLDYLCEILECVTGREIHGCIKVIEKADNEDDIDINNATMMTFCRSKNSQITRIGNDGNVKNPIKIIDNSDFYDILDSTNTSIDSCFYQSNLLDFAKTRKKSGKLYKNSTENWEDYYKSTIVAPIRVANERLFYKNLKQGFNVIGFMCVDSLATDAFRNNSRDKDNLTYIVKSFAAETYIVLNMYSYYLRKLKGDSNGKNT